MALPISTVVARTDGVTTASLEFSDWLSNQADDDYVLIAGVNDGGGTAIGGFSGWTAIHLDGAAVGGTRTFAYYKKRTGGVDVAAPTITGANEEWAVCALLIRDADSTAFEDATYAVTSQAANTATPTCPTLSTASANALIFRVVTRDGTSNPRPTVAIGSLVLGAHTTDTSLGAATSCSCSVYYTVKAAAGAVGTSIFECLASEGGSQLTIAIRNKSGGKIPAYPISTPLVTFTSLVSITTPVLLSTLNVSPETVLGRVCALGDATGGAVRNILSAQNAPTTTGAQGWVRGIGQLQTATTGVVATYGAAIPLAAPINLSANLLYTVTVGPSANARLDAAGPHLYFRDGSGNWGAWSPLNESTWAGVRPIVVHMPSVTLDDGGGTVDWTDIRHIGVAMPIGATTGTSATHELYFMDGIWGIPIASGLATPIQIVGGSSSIPFNAREMAKAIADKCGRFVYLQGAKQNSIALPVQIGDGGTTATHYTGDSCATEFTDTGVLGVLPPADSLQYRIKLGATDSHAMGAQSVGSLTQNQFIVDSASSTSATYSWRGTIFNEKITLIDGLTYDGFTAAGCPEIDAQAGLVNNCAITGTTSTDAAIAFDANSSMTGTTIDVTGTSAAYHLELGAAVSAFTITSCTFTGTASTDKIHVKKTTGTVTITTSGSGLVAGDITSDGATVSLVAPTDDLTVTSTESNTLLQIFTTGTQTVLASTTGASLVYTHSSNTVDIVAQKAGFIPQRVTGVALSGDITRAFTMVPDYNYNASHGLTYTTDASWASNQLTVPSWSALRTVRNVYSLMIDAFIAQASLRNTAFNLSMNGPSSLIFIQGAEGASDVSIVNMVGGGVRYLSPSQLITAEWVSVASAGAIPGGAIGEYQQQEGSGTTALRAAGAANQIIKTYGDATHGNFDYRGHLVVKYQINGYKEVRADVLAGAEISVLEPFEYVIPMKPVAINAAVGDPAITLAITKEATPVTWNGKDFSITILDGAGVSGESIIRELNYNLSLDATYQGLDPFNWPEMVSELGNKYESVAGIVEVDDSPALHGVRVIRTGDVAHPDFSRFQADDGTYYTVPITANVSITNIVSGSRLRIYNNTTATEIYNGITVTSYIDSYIDGTTYSDGDSVTVRLTQTATVTAKKEYTQTVIASSSGWSVLASQENDDVYNAIAIDGSTVTKFSADYVNDEVDLTVASNFTGAEFYAWWVYNGTTSQGISDFFGGMTALDQGNFRINTSTVNMYWNNNTASNVYQTDNRRIFRSDEAYPVANPTTGGGGIDLVWKNTILIATTGGSSLTPSQEAQLTQASQAATVNAKIGTPMATVSDDIASVKAKVDTLTNGPTLFQIEASTVLAKETTVESRASSIEVSNAVATLQVDIIDSQTLIQGDLLDFNDVNYPIFVETLQNTNTISANILDFNDVNHPIFVETLQNTNTISDNILDFNDVNYPIFVETLQNTNTISANIDLLDIPNGGQIADAVLARNLAGGTDGGRTVRDSLRSSRNRAVIDRANNTITVYQEDDTTIAWQGSITTEVGDAISEVNPA